MKEELIRLGIDYNDLVMRLGNKEILVEKFLRNFLCDKTIEAIKTNYQVQDNEQLMRAVHTLKGICANLSIIRLFEICNEWMQDLRNNKYENNEENYQKCMQEYTKIISGLKKIYNEVS